MNTRKTIGTSMIALLVVALSVSMAAADVGMIRAVDDSGADMTPPLGSFGPGDNINANGYNLLGTSADIYVVPERVWSTGDDMTLIPYTLIVPNVAPSEVAVPAKKLLGVVGNNPGEIPYPGEYDIFYDCDGNGKYDPLVDTVNQMSSCSAIKTEIPEFATLAIPVVALLGLVFFMRRKEQK